MNYFTRKNVITALIIVLLVVNVTALLTFVLRPHFLFSGHERSYCPRNNPRDFFKEELNLTEEQSLKFEQLRKNHRDTLENMMLQMKETRQVISSEMMKVKPDSVLLFSKTDELGDIYAAIRKLNILHYWRMKEICDDPQKQKLDSVFNKIFCCEDRMLGRCKNTGEDKGCRRNKHKGDHKNKIEDENNQY
jgi:hypothetical protein